LWGELLSTACRNTGCVGAIVDGAARDVGKMRALGFPVFARGTSPYDSLHRQRVIDLDVPVEIAGVRFAPGDLVFADEDGVVVVPQTVEDEAIARAWKKVHSENEVRDAIRAGMKATDVFAKFGIL
jgi:regulator of RNase E activity RraA